ncbi:MAG: cbb3-type cytochrome c oxidase subunit 3 [Halomonadaceae bacterium]|nr:MAG: cbb3-type cytochrome c oxidase subunit 3 [Halomonadaceae bacterium]
MEWTEFLSQFRGVHFLAMIVLFVGVCIWAFSPGRRKANEEASQLPFADDELDQQTRREQREKPPHE